MHIISIPVYGPGLIEASRQDAPAARPAGSIPVYGPGLIEARAKTFKHDQAA